MLTVKIIIASTRPGRKGPVVASWIHEIAKQHPEFMTEVLDLAEINLPFLDEPQHPRLQQYQHQHTKDWSEKINTADAFIIVTPEYNFGFPAPLKNALDYLYNEWLYKPVAVVSYGGVAAGTRSLQMLKQVLTALKMMPIADAVNIPFFTRLINEQNQFNADEGLTKSAGIMIKELVKWATALKTLREEENP